MAMRLDKGIHVKAGLVDGMAFGGPFNRYEPGTRRLVGVKMAAEIMAPADIFVPTADFSVPEPDRLMWGLKRALSEMSRGQDLYVGCMGGVGRTGLFLAVLAKAVFTYNEVEMDPVEYVRKEYNPHAVETPEQRQYIKDFDVGPAVRFLEALNAPQVEYVRCSPWQCIRRMFGFDKLSKA